MSSLEKSAQPVAVTFDGNDYILTLSPHRAHWMALSLLHGHLEAAPWSRGSPTG